MTSNVAHANNQAPAESSATRAYWVAQTAEFVRHRFDSATRGRLEAAFSSDLTSALGSGNLGDWVGRTHLIELFDAIAKVRGAKDDSFQDLVACGEFVERRTTNQFTALLMNILTPELFARKLPLFWQRDHGRAGSCVVDAGTAHSVRFHLNQVSDFMHVGPVWLGWVQAALTTLKVSSLQVSQSGWSPSTPSPQRVDFEVSWS